MNQQFSDFTPLNSDNSTGRKTYFWFRVYTVFLALLYLFVAAMGAFLVIVRPETREYGKTEMLIMGIVYLVLGVALFIPFIIAPFLPRRPWVWIYGIVLIAIGLTSCCFVPVCAPLLFYWLKPETKAMFDR